MRIIARRVLAKGMVTGVGFRYSTLRKAAEYQNLLGYVRNADERTVECVIQGPEADVDDLVQWLHRGPSSARVIECHVAELPLSKTLRPFHVAY